MGRVKGPTKARFETIFRDGWRERGEFVTLIHASGTGLLGIAAAKAIGSKPRRNLAKRRVRAALAKCATSDTFDYVLVVGAKSLDAAYEKLVEDVQAVLRRATERWESDSASS